MDFDSDLVGKDSHREEYNRQQKGKNEQTEEIDDTSALVKLHQESQRQKIAHVKKEDNLQGQERARLDSFRF